MHFRSGNKHPGNALLVMAVILFIVLVSALRVHEQETRLLTLMGGIVVILIISRILRIYRANRHKAGQGDADTADIFLQRSPPKRSQMAFIVITAFYAFTSITASAYIHFFSLSTMDRFTTIFWVCVVAAMICWLIWLGLLFNRAHKTSIKFHYMNGFILTLAFMSTFSVGWIAIILATAYHMRISVIGFAGALAYIIPILLLYSLINGSFGRKLFSNKNH